MCLATLKTVIYTWCKKTSSWTTFVAFRAHQLCSPGWFFGICQFYYNRNDFQAYIETHEPKLKGKILVYKKELSHWDKENGKATTIYIVIDADLSLQAELMTFLRSHKWSGRYAGVSFVPHKTNEVYTVQHKLSMYKRQNEWASNLKRVIINVSDANTQYKLDGQLTSFHDWLCMTPFGGKRVITGVEVAPKNVVRIMFNQNDRYDVEYILQNLYSMTEEKFGKEITSTLLDETELKKLRSNYKEEINHCQTLLQLSANPQGGSESSQYATASNRKSTFHYGTYLNVAKSEPTQTSEITADNETQTISKLRQAVQELKNKQDEFESNLTTKTDNAVTTKLQPLQNEITIMRNNNESKIGEVLDQLNQIQNNQATAIAAAVTSAMAAFLNTTPSGRAQLPPGGDK